MWSGIWQENVAFAHGDGPGNGRASNAVSEIQLSVL